MTKAYLLLTALIITIAAQSQISRKQGFINVHAGYGTEANMGHYGFFAGFASERMYKPKLSTEMAVSYFQGSGDFSYTNAKEKYHALFAVPKIGFLVIGNNESFFYTRLSAGPALKYFYNKDVRNISIRANPDGTRSVQEPVIYSKEQMFVFSVYSGLDFSFRLSEKVKAALFLDTYSREILLEHFMPGIKVGVKL